LQFYEVQVISGGTNVALQGTATQSSTYLDVSTYDASFAIDGSNSTFSHTKELPNQWWQVDLNSVEDIDSVVILNRACLNESQDECLCRLSNSTVQLMDAYGNMVSSYQLGDTCGEPAVTAEFSSCPSFSSPSESPSALPSTSPTNSPSVTPSEMPSLQPSDLATSKPSVLPSVVPSSQPTVQPSAQPSRTPSDFPSGAPSETPSASPSGLPSGQPSSLPSIAPSAR